MLVEGLLTVGAAIVIPVFIALPIELGTAPNVPVLNAFQPVYVPENAYVTAGEGPVQSLAYSNTLAAMFPFWSVSVIEFAPVVIPGVVPDPPNAIVFGDRDI